MGTAHLNDDGTETVALAVPIKWGKDIVAELVVKRSATLGDLERLDSAVGDFGRLRATIETMCSANGAPVSPSVVRQIDQADVRTLGEVLARHLGESQADGGN
jgi:hypothetical protein